MPALQALIIFKRLWQLWSFNPTLLHQNYTTAPTLLYCTKTALLHVIQRYTTAPTQDYCTDTTLLHQRHMVAPTLRCCTNKKLLHQFYTIEPTLHNRAKATLLHQRDNTELTIHCCINMTQLHNIAQLHQCCTTAPTILIPNYTAARTLRSCTNIRLLHHSYTSAQ